MIKFNLTWNAPRDNACPLNRYTLYHIEIQLNDTSQWHETKITNVAQTFGSHSLKCGRQYEFTLTASNDAGESHKSNPVNVTGISRILIIVLRKLFHNKIIQDGRESVVVREFASLQCGPAPTPELTSLVRRVP